MPFLRHLEQLQGKQAKIDCVSSSKRFTIETTGYATYLLCVNCDERGYLAGSETCTSFRIQMKDIVINDTDNRSPKYDTRLCRQLAMTMVPKCIYQRGHKYKNRIRHTFLYNGRARVIFQDLQQLSDQQGHCDLREDSNQLAKTSRDKGWRRQMPQCFEKTTFTALVLFVEFSECNIVSWRDTRTNSSTKQHIDTHRNLETRNEACIEPGTT